MEPQPDFDGLVLAGQMGQNRVAEQDLWKAVLRLPAWYFVADSAGDDAQPVIGALEGRPYLIAFTDEDRAERFAADRGRKRASDPTPVLHMDVSDAVAYCQDLSQENVEGILFNNGGYSFHARMSQVIDMHSRYSR